MANGVNTTNDRVFEYLQSAEPDKTFVDFFKIPEETTTETKEDIKTWKNFENALGDDFPDYKKMVLKKLWVEGGRPQINIMAGYDKKEEGSTTKYSPRRAEYGPYDWGNRGFKEGARDTLHIGLSQPVSNFMAEISHAFQWRQKPNEDIDTWEKRRAGLEERWWDERHTYGEDDVYGEDQLVLSEFQSNPDTEISLKLARTFPSKEALSFSAPVLSPHKGRVVYDPETRLGFGGEKPTLEFEAHDIIEDSLWQDYQKRFGEEWGETGKGWRSYQKEWSERNWTQQLIKEGLVE